MSGALGMEPAGLSEGSSYYLTLVLVGSAASLMQLLVCDLECSCLGVGGGGERNRPTSLLD